MDLQVALSPSLNINPSEFVSCWNSNPQSSDLAQARYEREPAKGYSPELIQQGLIFLAGIASSIAYDVVKDILKDRAVELLKNKSSSDQPINVNVIIINQGDNPIFVVKEID
jgi:hypothetical protein